MRDDNVGGDDGDDGDGEGGEDVPDPTLLLTVSWCCEQCEASSSRPAWQESHRWQAGQSVSQSHVYLGLTNSPRRPPSLSSLLSPVSSHVNKLETPFLVETFSRNISPVRWSLYSVQCP